MSNHFFNTPERIAALREAAKTWEWTPFAANGAIKGEGVCCHRLGVGVLADAGFQISQDEIPGGTMNRATHHTGSVMADWLRTQPERFAEVDQTAGLLPGDVLVIKLGVGANHIAIYLGGELLIQVWQGAGTHITTLVPTITKRIAYVFRPIEA